MRVGDILESFDTDDEILTLHRVTSVTMFGSVTVSGGSQVDASSYHANAVHFDGIARLTINSLTCTDGAFIAMSGWVNCDYTGGNTPIIWMVDPDNNANSSWNLTKSSHSSSIQMGSSDGLKSFQAVVAGSPSVWQHHLYAFQTDLGAGLKLCAAYINDVAQSFNAPSTIPFLNDASGSFVTGMNGLPLFFGGITGFANGNFIGDLADPRLMPNVNLVVAGDIPLATRRLFISASGKPVDPAIATAALGAPGTVLFSGGSVAFPTNQGSGGAFTLTGSLTNASTSPSD